MGVTLHFALTRGRMVQRTDGPFPFGLDNVVMVICLLNPENLRA